MCDTYKGLITRKFPPLSLKRIYNQVDHCRNSTQNTIKSGISYEQPIRQGIMNSQQNHQTHRSQKS